MLCWYFSIKLELDRNLYNIIYICVDLYLLHKQNREAKSINNKSSTSESLNILHFSNEEEENCNRIYVVAKKIYYNYKKKMLVK